MASPLPDWVPLNWYIINNPTNWAVVVLMVLLGTIVLCMLAGSAASKTVSE